MRKWLRATVIAVMALVLSTIASVGLIGGQRVVLWAQSVSQIIAELLAWGAVPHVSTNAALIGKTTTAYPAGVWRDDFAAGNGAPPLFFLPQNGTCAASGLVNDGGRCVNASGGNSWVSKPAARVDARQWGFVCNGTVPPGNAALLTAAASAASTTQAGLDLPGGVCGLDATATIPFGLDVGGQGMGAGPSAVSNNTGTQLLANFSSGPILTTTPGLYGVSYHDFQLNSNVGARSGNCLEIYGQTTPSANITANVQVHRVAFNNCFYELYLYQVGPSDISGNYFQGYGSSGIYNDTSTSIEGGPGDIHSNYFSGIFNSNPALVSQTSAFYSGTGYIKFHDNSVSGSLISVQIKIQAHDAGYPSITHNSIEDCVSYCVAVLNAGSGNAAISMAEVSYNEFSNVNASGISSTIFITSSATGSDKLIADCRVDSNVIRSTGNGSYSFMNLGNCAHLSVKNNILDGINSNAGFGILTNAGITLPATVYDNTFSGTWASNGQYFFGAPVTLRDLTTGFTVANLPSGITNGSQVFTTDGAPASSPCTGSSTGSIAFRQNGAWRCP